MPKTSRNVRNWGVEPATRAVGMRARAVRADRTLTIRLLDPSGRAVSGEEVRLLRVPGDAAPVRSGADGRPAADARVCARLDGTNCAFTRSDDGGDFVLYLDPGGGRVYEVYAYVQHTSGKLLMASVSGVEAGATGVTVLLPEATER